MVARHHIDAFLTLKAGIARFTCPHSFGFSCLFAEPIWRAYAIRFKSGFDPPDAIRPLSV